jgi:hypothetical protein
MLNWFRKNQRVLLVVFVALLMVVFLLPSGGAWLTPKVEDHVIGAADGVDVTLGDQRRAQYELDLLERLGARIGITDGLAWHLLMIEARRHGIYVSDDLIDQQKQRLRSMNVPLGRLGSDESSLNLALRHGAMFNQLANMMGVMPHSEPRLRRLAMDYYSSAAIELVAVDAQYLADQSGEPTEDQIKQQFEKHKADRPGSTKPHGFGYYLPARIKFEYLKFSLPAIAATVQIDEIKAMRYYQEHPERFLPKPPPEDPSKKEEAKKQEPGKPAGPLPYKEVRKDILQQLTDEAAREIRDKAAKWASAQLADQYRRLPLTKEGYIDLPTDFKPASMEDVARAVHTEYKFLPDYVRVDRWQAPSEAAKEENLDTITLPMADGREAPFSAYLASLRELNPPASNPLVVQRLQANIPSRLLTDGAGNAYLVRVNAADPSREPKSLDEVRDRVVRDLKRVRAFDLLKERAESLLSRAKAEGLDKLAPTLNAKVEKIPSFSGRDLVSMQFSGKVEPPDIKGIGRSDEFVQAVFALGRKIHDAGGVAKAKPEDLLIAVPVESSQTLALAKLTDYLPVNSAEFERAKPTLPRFMQARWVETLQGTNPFEFKAIAKRVGFVEADKGPDRPLTDAPAVPTHPLDNF